MQTEAGRGRSALWVGDVGEAREKGKYIGTEAGRGRCALWVGGVTWVARGRGASTEVQSKVFIC